MSLTWDGMMGGLTFMASANILDVAPQQGVAGVSGTATAGLSDTEHLSSGDCACNQASPADSKVLDVADLATGPLVGNPGGEVKPSCSSPLKFPADDDLRWADNVSRFVDSVLDARDVAEQERLEEIEAAREGLMTEMSGYRDAGVRP